MSEYQVFEDKAGEWRWRLVANNGEIVAQSEAYTNELAAYRGVKDAKAVAQEADDESA